MVSDEIERWFNLPPRQRVLIRNGVDLVRFHPPAQEERVHARRELQLPSDDSIFLLVGSGFERKGVANALQAFSRLREGQLVVVGHDRRASEYHRLAERLSLGGRMHFVGPQLDVLPGYHASDVFVLPTLYDPQPNAVLEAMACGLPVVTTYKCGASELLGADSGAVCDALDIDALATALQRFADRDVARKDNASARAAIEPHSLERMSTEYLKLYQRLLEMPR